MTKDVAWKLSVAAINALDEYLEARSLAAALHAQVASARAGGVKLQKARRRAAGNSYTKRGALQVALAKLAGGSPA